MKLEIYQDAHGTWRWRLRHRNGRIVADSGEGYDSKGNAKRAWTHLQKAIRKTVIVVVEVAA